MKKITSLFLVLSLVFALAASAGAEEVSASNNSDPRILATVDASTFSNAQLESMKEKIQSLSNEKYDELLAYLVSTTTDAEALRDSLSLVGVELSEVRHMSRNPEAVATASIVPLTEAYQSNMYVYDSSRTGSSNKRISVCYQLKTKESKPGSYDAVTLFFNSNRAQYVSISTDQNYSGVKNATKATKGTVVFNFYDKIAGTNVSHSTVEVKRTSTASPLYYSALWDHSFTKTNATVAMNPSVSFGGEGGVSGSIGVSISFSSAESSWQLSDAGYYS